MTHAFHPSILRDYDIRGVVGKTLGEADAYAVGRTFGTVVARGGGRRVAVGYDGRLSSPALETALVAGLNAAGVDVVRIGLGPSPMLYYAEAELEVDGGVQITGSHNPADHNGFKLVLGHSPFFGEDIQRLGRMAAAGNWVEGTGGVERVDVIDRYAARLVRDFGVQSFGGQGFDGSGFRIGWDAGNGAAGPVVEKLVQLLPGEHHLLFTDVDGDFPHHHPDPTEEANLAHLRALVADKKLDFGVAFDGDGDRIGAIDGEGRVIWGDQLLALFAEPVLREWPGSTIVGDVKMSQLLFDRVAELGGRPLMWKSGHSHIKSKMKEAGSPLAGEMSGHIFFGPPYYGFDDALCAAVRLIQLVGGSGKTLAALRDSLGHAVNTPELRFPVEEAYKFAIIEDVVRRLRAEGADINETDGARVVTADGWWLLRASNTQAMLTARAEAKTPEGLNRLMEEVESRITLSTGVIGKR